MRSRLGRGMPQGGEAQESQGPARGEIQRRYAPTGRGKKPLKRGRCGSNAYVRRKRRGTTDLRGTCHLGDVFDEWFFGTTNLREVPTSRLIVCNADG
jgi:hypothetical protein